MVLGIVAAELVHHVSVEGVGPPLSSVSQLHFYQNTGGCHVDSVGQLHLGEEGVDHNQFSFSFRSY